MFNQIVTRTMIGTLGTAVFAGICLLGAAAPAFADTVDAPRSQVVRVSDLDVANASGRALLEARVRRAAHQVCATDRIDLQSRSDEARCVSRAVDAAAPRMVIAMASNAGR